MNDDVSAEGHILQVSTSAGGVPKRGVAGPVHVGLLGLAGDGHLDMVHHGGADRAVCLFSLERILALQREGHPIFPGSVGENITTVGLNIDRLAPGVRLAVGNELILEVTSYTVPCRNIAESFTNSEFSRISQKTHPGWSRLYAKVLREGSIHAGAAIRIDD